ncbi:MAG: hypothetical protein ACI92G_000777 [Candidatus Pelagisphaera sp.]
MRAGFYLIKLEIALAACGTAFWLFMISSTARGVRGTRNLMAFFFLVSGFSVYQFPNGFEEDFIVRLHFFQTVVRFWIGLVMVLSKDVNLYLALQYEKLIAEVEEGKQKKKAENIR